MTKPFENAFWIWDDGDPAPVNAYRAFRKSFFVPAGVETYRTAHICADTKYQVILNSRILGRGPAPSAKGRYAYDEYNFLLEENAENVIFVYVHYVGVPMFSYFRNRGGLLFEMGDIVSDSSWLVSNISEWEISSPRLSSQRGFCEYQDARVIRANQFVGDVDEQQWLQATKIAGAYEYPWPVLEPRDLYHNYHIGEWRSYDRLIGYGNCGSTEGETAAARMQNEQLAPLTSGRIDTLDFAFDVYPGDKDIWLLFDMGREVCGTVDLDIESKAEGNSGVIIDIAYDEAIRPDETDSGLRHTGVGGETNLSDRLTLEGHGDPFAGFSARAFRYARLAIRGLISPINISSFGVHETVYKIERTGAMTTSEPRLNRIWEIGKHTLHLCMDDRFMDCPSRERAQYIADARIGALGACYCFGDSLLHRRFLRQTALSQHSDGRIDPVGPGEWDVLNPNMPIPGFVAIYVQSVLDYYMMTADGTLVEEVMPAVLKALGWMASFGAGEGGLLSNVPGWNFTDWAVGLGSWPPGGPDNGPGIAAGVNLFYLQALRAAARLAEFTGDQAAVASNRTRATMIAGAFDSIFWNPLRGVYVDSVVEGAQSATASQQINCLALLLDVGGTGRREQILDRLLTDETLTQIGTPYFSFYLVEALAHVGQHQTALDYIRKHWGAMMDAGATSWWETWDGGASRCHAWSIAPNIWLPQQILGVSPHEAGFACVNIAPKPCDLKWVKGIVPIPQGNVVVSWLVKDGRFTLDVTVPTGVHLRPVLPCSPSDALFVDGQPVDGDSLITRNATEVELAVLPGSGYRFEVVAAKQGD